MSCAHPVYIVHVQGEDSVLTPLTAVTGMRFVASNGQT